VFTHFLRLLGHQQTSKCTPGGSIQSSHTYCHTKQTLMCVNSWRGAGSQSQYCYS